jgi:hypothetical protein
MRAILVVVAMALVGCGRFGFTLRGDADRDGGVGDDMSNSDAVANDDDASEGPFIGDPDGFWELAEGRILGEGGVRSSSDLMNGIRGNALIAAGQLHLRFLALAAGAQAEIGVGSSELTIEGERWVSSDGTTVAVSMVRWNGPDEVTVTWNPGDRDTVGKPRLEMIRIVRAVAPPASLVGAKTLARVAYDGISEFAAGTCAPNVGGESQIVAGRFEITGSLLVNVDFDFQFFGTANCTGLMTPLKNTGAGYLEVDGTRYRLWLSIETYEPVAMSGSIVVTDSSIRLARDTCEPATSTACAEFPIAIETTP